MKDSTQASNLSAPFFQQNSVDASKVDRKRVAHGRFVRGRPPVIRDRSVVCCRGSSLRQPPRNRPGEEVGASLGSHEPGDRSGKSGRGPNWGPTRRSPARCRSPQALVLLVVAYIIQASDPRRFLVAERGASRA